MFSPFIQYFQDKHIEFCGFQYAVNWGKDNKIIKELSRIYDPPTMHKLIDLFFEKLKDDTFLQSTGPSIGIFKTQIPKLIMEISQQQEDKEVGTW